MTTAITYSKTAQYTLPKGNWAATYMDGIYINGNLFDNNIPVIDGVIRIGVWPQNPDAVDRWANFGFPTYQNGQVIRIGHQFRWYPGSGEGQSHDLRYNGYPYGMGLNTIAVQLDVSPVPITRDIVYKVVYVFIMEVGS
jgi:hypothetical protein